MCCVVDWLAPLNIQLTLCPSQNNPQIDMYGYVSVLYVDCLLIALNPVGLKNNKTPSWFKKNNYCYAQFCEYLISGF